MCQYILNVFVYHHLIKQIQQYFSKPNTEVTKKLGKVSLGIFPVNLAKYARLMHCKKKKRRSYLGIHCQYFLL